MGGSLRHLLLSPASRLAASRLFRFQLSKPPTLGRLCSVPAASGLTAEQNLWAKGNEDNLEQITKVTGNSIAEWSKGKGLFAHKRDAAAVDESKDNYMRWKDRRGEGCLAMKRGRQLLQGEEGHACCFPVQKGQTAEAQVLEDLG